MSRNLRVGLMGGSFDPIHIGHVRIASEARKALDLDRVLFLPSGRPPHEAHLGASAAQRLEMTKLATQGLPWAEASDIEVFREGTIYTVDTLTTIRKLKEKGVGVTFEKENIDTLDSKGELLITIMSSLAQEESRSISENRASIPAGWRRRWNACMRNATQMWRW